MAHYFCHHFGVSDPSHITFHHLYGQHAVEAHMLSNSRTISVEYSITGRFNPDRTGEEQVVKRFIPSEGTKDADVRVFYMSTNNRTFQPNEPFCHPVTGQVMESDLDKVALFQVVCRTYSSDMSVCVAPRMSREHRYLYELEGYDVSDAMMAEAGAPARAFVNLTPTEDGKEEQIQCAPMPERPWGYVNAEFNKTFTYLNRQNIMNGIIHIDAQTCEEAGLPIWKGVPEEAPEDLILKQFESLKITDDKSKEALEQRKQINRQYQEQFVEMFDTPDYHPTNHWVAIPDGHVLSWGYSSDQYRDERGHQSVQFLYRDNKQGSEPVLLFHLVTDYQFEKMVEEFATLFLHKVDMYPLNQVGMEFLPYISEDWCEEQQKKHGNGWNQTGTLKLRVQYSYTSGPTLNEATVNALAPTLSPKFPKCGHWSKEETAKRLALKEYSRLHGK